jgi:hypothetical protein
MAQTGPLENHRLDDTTAEIMVIWMKSLPGMSPDKVAFRKTFWLNHQLYQTGSGSTAIRRGQDTDRDSLWIRYEKGFISEGLIPGDDPALAAYYLNPEHYWGTEDEEIEALLQGFWQEYSRWFDRTQILEALGLPEQTGERELKKALKLRVKESHPDQGGDREEFQKVWAAWEKYRQAKNRP